MQPQNPDYQTMIQQVFSASPFMQELGARLLAVGPGWCECELPLGQRHMQHSGVVHAGVQTTLVDNACGAAAGTLIAADELILSVNFTMHLLRAATGERLFCRAEVLKPGSRFSVVEGVVYAITGQERRLTAKMSATMAVLKQPQ
jgi:uncharacterized protein (TIGR00369 family)